MRQLVDLDILRAAIRIDCEFGVLVGEQRLDNVPQVADIASDFVFGPGALGEIGCRPSLQETQ